MKISDDMKLLAPAITGLRHTSSAFAVFPASPGLERLTQLEGGVGSVLSTLDSIGSDLETVVASLDDNVGKLDIVLPSALADLGSTYEFKYLFANEIEALKKLEGTPSEGHVSTAVFDALDELLRPLYTMITEREVHNRHLCRPSSTEVATAEEGGTTDSLFSEILF